MNKKIVIGIIIALIIIVVAGWLFLDVWQHSSTSDNRQAQTSGNQTQPENAVAAATITYTDSGFAPEQTTVKAGDTIRIVNQSSGGLEFSSDNHPTHTLDPELNMDTIDPGKDQMLKVTRTGTWGYHNHLKASDTGKITVTD